MSPKLQAGYLLVKTSVPYFSTRPRGARRKFGLGTRLQDHQFRSLCIYWYFLQRISWTSHWWGAAPSGELPRQCCCKFMAHILYPLVSTDQALLHLPQGMKSWMVAWQRGHILSPLAWLSCGFQCHVEVFSVLFFPFTGLWRNTACRGTCYNVFMMLVYNSVVPAGLLSSCLDFYGGLFFLPVGEYKTLVLSHHRLKRF